MNRPPAFRSLAALLLLAGCAVLPYQPLPVEHSGPLPPDAYQRVRSLLLQRYGALAVHDEPAFRLQTPWLPFHQGEHPGERRATVFRDDDGRLMVVVEVRFLRLSAWNLPEWSSVRGDAAQERELAEALATVLR